MRRSIALIVALAVSSAVAGSASGGHRLTVRTVAFETATGRVSALDLSAISVGPLRCSFRSARIADLAGNYAIGENVTIGCLAHALRSIEIAPVTTGPTHADSIVGTTTPRPTGGLAATGAQFLGWTSGSTAARTVTGTVNVTGAITAIDPTGITIAGQTCPLFSAGVTSTPSGSLPAATLGFLSGWHVGQAAEMSCTLFSDGLSSGQVRAA